MRKSAWHEKIQLKQPVSKGRCGSPVCLSEGRKKVSPDKMVEMQAKIDEERKALEAKLDMEEEERNKARAELEKREKDLLKAQ